VIVDAEVVKMTFFYCFGIIIVFFIVPFLILFPSVLRIINKCCPDLVTIILISFAA